VIALMHLMYPVAYPTALLLDWILGEDHGTIYKKAGLKTLVTLHKTLGPHPSERLNEDEVTIISAVLDLKEKPVGAIMTPIKDVFTMSADKVLDELTMDEILSAGYSRIPIHVPGESHNFVGMLLVKMLITYDPEDEKRVGEFPLATLPETAEDTSCLDIVNFFQEGKSHMVLVSERPGENHGALGVVTLEDVIEELIGEEIVDESDVFIDVHKAIRRLNPSPLALGLTRRPNFPHSVSRPADPPKTAFSTANAIDFNDSIDLLCTEAPEIQAGRSATPVSSESSLVSRRRSASNRRINGYGENVMAHLNLGPANLAGRPRETKSKTVKIKQTDQTRQSFDAGLGRVDGAADFNSHYAEPLRNVPEEIIKKGSEVLQVPRSRGRKKAKMGSLVERVDIVDGVCKTIIETTSDSDDEGSGESDSGSTSSRRKIKGGKLADGADRSEADRSGEMSPLLWRGG
jgi:metal transporter CNNM